MSIPILCEDLSKRFRGVQAVDRLSFEVPEGAVYGLVGPNGAGKSTAIKTMMNIIRADSGRVEIFGVPSRSLGPSDFAKIGYAFGEPATAGLDDGRVFHDIHETLLPGVGRYPRATTASPVRLAA